MKQFYNFDEIGELLGTSGESAKRLWETKEFEVFKIGKFNCGRRVDIEAVLGSKLPDDTPATPEVKQLENKVVLVTVEEERKAILDDANKECEEKKRECEIFIAERKQKAMEEFNKEVDEIREGLNEREKAVKESERALASDRASLARDRAKLIAYDEELEVKTKRKAEYDRVEWNTLSDARARFEVEKVSIINRKVDARCLSCKQGKYIYDSKKGYEIS